eukprot:8218058-Pyramimonas_sp.AAC.1
MSLLALVAAAESSNGGGPPQQQARGRGRGDDPSKASAYTVVRKIAPILISLDRRVGCLEDRASFVIIVKGEEEKKTVSTLRDLWRTDEKARRDEVGGGGDDVGMGAPKEMRPHQLGGSQRS